MATFAFQTVLVWTTNPGGVVRLLRNGAVTVYNAATDAVLFNLTSDSAGLVSFTTTDVPTVYLKTTGWTSEHITAASAIEAAAAFSTSEDAAVATLVNDTGSATRAGLNSTYAAKGELVPNAKDHGIVGDGATDDTAAFNAALAAGDLFVPPGTYAVSGTILVPADTRLDLGPGVTLVRTGASTEPVVWLRESSATLRGAGIRSTTISTPNASPLGVVCVGYKGTADTARQANYNTVRDLAIIGKVAGGQSTGTPSVALLLCNMEIGGLTSYFGTYKNLYLANANIGLQFLGGANANHVANIQLNGIGNGANNTGNPAGAGIAMTASSGHPPLENSIQGVFHTFSADATTLLLSGAGIAYNDIHGLLSEQGGTFALWIKNTDDTLTNNSVSGSANVAGGSSFTTNFLKNNRVQYDGNIFTNALAAAKVTAGQIVFSGDPVASARTAGTAAALPAQPVGYFPITIYGATNWVPYYA